MRILTKIVLILVGLFVAVTLLGLWGPRVAGWWRDYQMGVEARRVEEAVRALETARANDRDGGKTPEETLELFMVALKDKNTLQASKYYEVSVQPKALANLQAELAKEGNLQKSIDYFTELKTRGEKKCNENGDGCVFDRKYTAIQDENIKINGTDSYMTLKKGQSLEESVVLTRNSKTLVWKLEQPF